MMKTYNVPWPYAVIMVLAFLGLAFYLLKKREVDIEELITKRFSGKIIMFEHAGRGSMKILLENEQKAYIISGFAKYMTGMKKGDSLSKQAHSSDIYYYKRDTANYYLFDIFTIQ